eukprot:2099696-Prymnesium_polylepis.1
MAGDHICAHGPPHELRVRISLWLVHHYYHHAGRLLRVVGARPRSRSPTRSDRANCPVRTHEHDGVPTPQ